MPEGAGPGHGSYYAPEVTQEIESLLHFDTTKLTDEVRGATWTKIGNAAYSTNSPKFGNGCLYLSDASSYIKGVNTKGLFSIEKQPDEGNHVIYEFAFFAKISSENNGQQYGLIQLCSGDNVIMNIGINANGDEVTGLPNTRRYVEFNPNGWDHIALRFGRDSSYANRCEFLINGYIYSNKQLLNEEEAELWEEEPDFPILSSIDNVRIGGFIGYIDEFVFRKISVTPHDDDYNSDIEIEDYNYSLMPIIPSSAYTVPDIYRPEGDIKELGGPIYLRGGTAAALAAVNPILAQREIMVEYDTGKIKVGNGTSRWNSLGYVGAGL